MNTFRGGLSNMDRLAAILTFLFMLCSHGASADVKIVRNDPGKVGVVIFVHGIVGDDTTWSNTESGKPGWLDIVEKDGLFEDMNILSHSYPSALFSSGATTDQLAANLRREIEGHGGGNYERIVFVAHSLGSIITTKLLLQDQELAKKTKAVFFYSAPFAGSQLAVALRLVPGSSALISDLSGLRTNISKEAFLVRLRNSWRNSRLAMQIPVYCAYETRGTPIPHVPNWVVAAKVVEPDSAERLCSAAFSPIEKHHMNIVRPDGDRIFTSHQYLRSWYAQVFPYAAQSLGPADSQVVMADCTVDRYGNDFKAAMFEDVAAVTKKGMRLTRRLPEDWRPANRPLLWNLNNQPKLLVIHFSCFQQGAENNSDERNRERADDFVRLLATLQDSDVRVLVFSRAFRTSEGEKYLFEYPIAAEFRDKKKLFTMATSNARAYAGDPSQRGRFKDLIKSILENTPEPPPPPCRC
jgi:pimeloyl-ACP methyl ester carboxylesterase